MNDAQVKELDVWAAEKRRAEVVVQRGGYTLAVVRGTLTPRSIPALFPAWLVLGSGSSGTTRAYVMPEDFVTAWTDARNVVHIRVATPVRKEEP